MNNLIERSSKTLLLAGFSLFLSSFTLVLGAVPLHVWRQAYGRVRFVFGAGLLTAGCAHFGQWPLAVAIGVLSIVVLIFNEMDERGWGLVAAGGGAVFGGAVAVFGLGRAWVQQTGQSWQEALKAPVESFLAQVASMNGGFQVPAEDIVAQAPSGAVILMIASLALALLFEMRLRLLLKLPYIDRSRAFLGFRLPDVLVWLTIAALLAAFLKTETPVLQKAGTNLLNILIFLYFLQGLAIVTEFFNFYRVGHLWRGLAYIFLVMQLFLFVSCLGFVDFWADFRQRLTKRTLEKEEQEKKINGKGGIS